jgi:hypothetical protein
VNTNEETTLKKKQLLSQKVATVAGSVVSKQGYVSAIDLFLGLGWLSQANLSAWKKRQVPYLERIITTNLKKISRTMKEFRLWANHSKLKKSIAVYKHKSQKLRFSKSGNPNIELAYSTHFVLLKDNKNKSTKTDIATVSIDGA